MLRRVIAFGFALVTAAGLTSAARAEEEAKADKDTKVEAGKEFKLTPVEVTPAEKPEDDGRYEATVKAAKETKKVKMPAEVWELGFVPKAVKGGGVAVAETTDGSALKQMRTEAGKEDGSWMADPDDVITHVNGYAVNSVEEILVAVSTAKKKDDVQLVIKDVNTGKLTIFYVTATKR
jgi:S1-C subfamily serine protease